jgi:hypothetical protein
VEGGCRSLLVLIAGSASGQQRKSWLTPCLTSAKGHKPTIRTRLAAIHCY